MDIIYIIGSLAGFVVVVVLLREVVLWYWKIGVLVQQQRETNRILTRISRKLDRLLPEERDKIQ